MCGIAGICQFDKQPIPKELLQRMGDLIAHRGPDDEGFYNKDGVGLVNRRLAIIDLSPLGHQPMSNEDGSIWITFNGEIYNYLELRQELEKRGHQFRSHSDTEAIVHAYEEWGFDSVSHLRGMFAYAIWDSNQQQLFLARDRLGKKPLFYTQTPHAFVFGSELRCLLQHPEVTRSVNLDAIHAYFTRVYVPAPLTAFAGIYKLPAAHYMVVHKNETIVERYWHVDFGKKQQASEEEVCEQLWDLLQEATRIRLMSDVPLGALLSGGIDSSAVVGIMSQLTSEPVKTFSIRFDEQTYDETPYARKIAELFGTEHHEFNVRPDAISVLPELVWHYGEPFGDYSSLPSYYVSKMARQYVTVALSGDAGDENFAGYNRYRSAYYLDMYQKLPISMRKSAIPSLMSGLGRLPGLANSMHRLETVARRGASSPASSYLYSYSFFTPESAAAIWAPEKLAIIDRDFFVRDLESKLKEFRGANSLDRWLYLDLMSYLPDDINVKMDIASMANSLEVRAPFMDHKLVEFAAGLPAKMKRNGTTGKYILKKTLERLLPKDILYRPKHGFSVPVSEWLRGPLGDLLRQVLLDPATKARGYLQMRSVEKLIREHEEGTIDHGMRLWLLLNFELWQRTYIDELHQEPLVL